LVWDDSHARRLFFDQLCPDRAGTSISGFKPYRRRWTGSHIAEKKSLPVLALDIVWTFIALIAIVKMCIKVPA